MTSSMKKRAALTTAVLTAAGLSACGGGGSGTEAAAPPGQTTPPAQAQSLDTAQVQALAEKPSETASPFPVDNGLLTLNDTSETTEPIAVNGP
jgi:hypothetical protein